MTAANSLSSHLYTKSDNPKIVALIALQSAAIGTFNKAALGDRYPPARSTHDPTLPSGGGRPPKVEISLSEPHSAVRTGQGPLITSQAADNGLPGPTLPLLRPGEPQGPP